MVSSSINVILACEEVMKKSFKLVKRLWNKCIFILMHNKLNLGLTEVQLQNCSSHWSLNRGGSTVVIGNFRFRFRYPSMFRFRYPSMFQFRYPSMFRFRQKFLFEISVWFVFWFRFRYRFKLNRNFGILVSV
jgi:hypothetical protein